MRMPLPATAVTVGFASALLFVPVPVHAQQKVITVGTGGIVGVHYPLGGAICRFVNAGRKDRQDVQGYRRTAAVVRRDARPGGGGHCLTRVAFALMGHMRGGPAGASVLSSGLDGMISGSSVANVLTGGNVTIMLMKRVGYPPVKAGAIELASSSNGPIMPPVMGAAAFLMVEYVNIPLPCAADAAGLF